ncbi:glucokinase [Leptolyngbya sp. FACHB-261]|uniref:glucokinase n=1 Tax=Leptolyngbya sp. FACHB-261 TaxID=2692806 RepID=UPI001684597C|nr:glucokinase [Leptolyngbya sp. FACHB-261]MBD2103842.1 glucokinase [Leptolyngbya sp. FACHB-261]
MTRLLAGDIGGTKTILRLLEIRKGERQTLLERRYTSADYPHLAPVVQAFLQESEAANQGDELPSYACFAIAGPVINDTSELTNLSWKLDGRQLEQELGIDHVHLINDFAAVGYGLLALGPEDLEVLQPGRPNTERQSAAPIIAVGAGTGLGQAFLIHQPSGYEVFASEGGHADFAPRTEQEVGLLHYLLQRYGRVSAERVVSGQGITAIYEYLRDSQYAPESEAVRREMAQQDPSAVVSTYALAHKDRLCEQALEIFVSAYGAEVGNLAIKVLAYGGVYITGGIAPKILPKLKEGSFLESFLAKGRMRPLMEQMPVYVVLNAKVGLMGAAVFAERMQQNAL